MEDYIDDKLVQAHQSSNNGSGLSGTIIAPHSRWVNPSSEHRSIRIQLLVLFPEWVDIP